MYTVIETPTFQRLASDILSDDERELLISWIASNPLVGEVMVGTDGLRKVRWSRTGMGKRSGSRVIYFNRLSMGEIVLLMIYAKAKLDNVRPEFLAKLKEQFDG